MELMPTQVNLQGADNGAALKKIATNGSLLLQNISKLAEILRSWQ